MRNYTIVTNPTTKEKLLQVNGSDTFCPYTQPIPMQSNMGQVQLVRFPCSERCPHFCLDEENKTLKTMCVPNPEVKSVEIIEPEKQSAFSIK